MISPSYVDGLELRIKELTQSNRSFVSALQKAEVYNVQLERQLSDERMENLRLETERDALAAQNIKMMQSILYCTIYLDDNKLNSIATGSKAHVMLADAITATPLQCLAEIKAEAGRAGYVEGYLDGYNDNALDEFNQDSYADLYAAKVRQGGE